MVLKVEMDGSHEVVECQLANTRVSSITRLPARYHQHGLHLQVVVLIDVGTLNNCFHCPNPFTTRTGKGQYLHKR